MSKVEHRLIGLLVICTSLEKYLLGLLPIFWLRFLLFWYWAVWVAYIFWRLTLCQLLHLQLFSPILRVVFSSCLVYFAMQKLLSFIRSHLFTFVFISIKLEVGQRESYRNLSRIVLPMFSSKSFTVSGLTFKSLILFELIFVYGFRKCSVILLHIAVQFSQHHLVKRLCFLHCIYFSPLSKIRCP